MSRRFLDNSQWLARKNGPSASASESAGGWRVESAGRIRAREQIIGARALDLPAHSTLTAPAPSTRPALSLSLSLSLSLALALALFGQTPTLSANYAYRRHVLPGDY